MKCNQQVIITDDIVVQVEKSVQCMCVCVRFYIRTITSERNDLWPRYLAWWLVLTLSRSSLNAEGQSQGHWRKIATRKNMIPKVLKSLKNFCLPRVWRSLILWISTLRGRNVFGIAARYDVVVTERAIREFGEYGAHRRGDLSSCTGSRNRQTTNILCMPQRVMAITSYTEWQMRLTTQYNALQSVFRSDVVAGLLLYALSARGTVWPITRASDRWRTDALIDRGLNVADTACRICRRSTNYADNPTTSCPTVSRLTLHVYCTIFFRRRPQHHGITISGTTRMHYNCLHTLLYTCRTVVSPHALFTKTSTDYYQPHV